MTTINQILAIKGNQVHTIDPDTPIIDAVKEMAEKKVGALVVLEDEDIKGIITEQDFTRRVILNDRDTDDTKVKDVMTRQVSVISPAQTTHEGMAIMTDKCVRHLPVIQDNKMIGLISIGDLVKEVISEQEHIIEQLEQYIHG